MDTFYGFKLPKGKMCIRDRFQIGKRLTEQVKNDPRIELWTDATVLGLYEDGIATVYHENRHKKVRPRKIIVSTGAAEKFLAFPGNDLPGIYGAGAVQTLMNVAGVKPARRVLMVGAGNIGLIVSYQLLQAGVEVAAVAEAAPRIGGFLVHASKPVSYTHLFPAVSRSRFARRIRQ